MEIISREEISDFLNKKVFPKQIELWKGILSFRPEFMAMNVETKDHFCEVSVKVYEEMIKDAGKGKTLIELGGGLPREGLYLLEAGLVSKVVSIDSNLREFAQTRAISEMLGMGNSVVSIPADLEKQWIEGYKGIVVSKNFLYGAANSVEEYMFMPSSRVYVNSRNVISNTKHMCDSLFGVIRIIANNEGKFSHSEALNDFAKEGFAEKTRGSLPLKRRESTKAYQISSSPFMGVVAKEYSLAAADETAVDYVIAQKKQI